MSGSDTLLGGIGTDSLDGGTDNDRLMGDVGNDTLLGGAGNDYLDGGADNDKLDGGAGADTLDGGTGADTLLGSDGNDLYLIDNIGDRISEAAKSSSGIDTVESSIDYTLGANLEHLILTGLAQLKAIGNVLANRLTGNAGDNRLDGGSGFDTLVGGAGDDTLIGGTGVDQLTGGDGSDTYQISSTEDIISETASYGDQDVVESSVSYTLGANLEFLTLTGLSRSNGTGNELANTLEGNGSDNTLNGEAGDDILIGNAGDDTLQGGAGDDEMDGGEGDDQVVYQGKRDDYKIDFDTDSQTWIIADINGDSVNEGTDRLTHIETLLFADGAYQPGQPSLSVADISLNEGNTGTGTARFILSLSEAAIQPVTVGYITQDGTARAGSDYLTQSGSVSFAPGESQKVIAVSVLGDTQLEDNESFFLQLTEVTGADLDNGLATATLVNDDRPSLGISDSRVSESAGAAAISVTLQAAATTPVSVNYASLDVTATAGKDYTPARGTLTFVPGETSKTIPISLPGDSQIEADESFRVLLSSPTGATLDAARASAIVTLLDDDTLSLILSSDPTRLKAGDTATLRFSFSDIPVGFTASDISLSGGSLSGFQADATGKTYTALFTPNLQSNTWQASISVNAGSYTDSQNRPGPVGNSLSFSGDTLSPTLTITSDKTSLKAGDTATLRFSFTELPQGFTQSDIETSNGSLSNLQADSSGLLYTATFTPTANVAGNDAVIRVGVGSYTDAAGNPGQASTPLNISLDTRLPGISLSGVTVNEGQAGTSPVLITVNLSMTPIQPVSVNYATVDGTALAGSDYTATSGTLTFQPGETSKTIPIAVIGDATAENDENFQVQLSAATNAVLGSNSATVTLTNDDQPTISLSGTSLSEGNFGSSNATVTVSLSATYNQTVSVNYATVDGTALAGSDYTATTGILSFAPGETSKTIQTPVLGDTAVENDETFQIQLSGAANAVLGSNAATVTLTNDDAAALPVLAISGTTLAEGQSGASFASVTATLSAASSQIVTVNYATQDGTASSGSDYVAASGALTFQPGQTSQTIQIPVIGDTTVEADEAFRVTLTSPLNASLGSQSSAAVTLTNDDVVLPALSISGTRIQEGNSGSSSATVTVSLSAKASQTVTVHYATQDGTATANSDYIGLDDTLTFVPGETSKTVQVPILGDTTVEPDENFQVQLSNPQNANLSTASSALIDLLNDDVVQVSSYTPGQAVIDLGSQYGKLIHPMQVDGGHFFYYWDISGDGTSSSTQGAGYANSSDYVIHDWLDTIFQQDVNGRIEGENGAPVVGTDGDTDNTYRFATINGVKLALPTIGNGETVATRFGYQNGTAVSGTASNPTYDDYLAIWDAYNGTGTGTGDYGTPGGWDDGVNYWSATPSASGHADISLFDGYVDDSYGGYYHYVAVEVW